MPPDTTRECLLSSPGSVSKSWKVGGRSQRMVGTGHQLTLDQYVWQWGHVETPTTHCTDTSSSPQLMFTVFCSHSKKHLLSYLTQDAKAYIFTQIFLGIRLKYFSCESVDNFFLFWVSYFRHTTQLCAHCPGCSPSCVCHRKEQNILLRRQMFPHTNIFWVLH